MQTSNHGILPYSNLQHNPLQQMAQLQANTVTWKGRVYSLQLEDKAILNNRIFALFVWIMYMSAVETYYQFRHPIAAIPFLYAIAGAIPLFWLKLGNRTFTEDEIDTAYHDLAIKRQCLYNHNSVPNIPSIISSANGRTQPRITIQLSHEHLSHRLVLVRDPISLNILLDISIDKEKGMLNIIPYNSAVCKSKLIIKIVNQEIDIANGIINCLINDKKSPTEYNYTDKIEEL